MMVSSFGSEYLDDNLYLLIPCYIHFKAAFIFSKNLIIFFLYCVYWTGYWGLFVQWKNIHLLRYQVFQIYLTRSPRFVPPLVVEKCLNIRTWTGKEISRRKHLCLNRIWCAEKRWWHALFPNSVFRIHILNSLNVGFDWCPGNEVIPIRNYMLILELGKWFILCIID